VVAVAASAGGQAGGRPPSNPT